MPVNYYTLITTCGAHVS